MMTAPAGQDLGQGIHVVDTGYYRPGLAACYVMHEGDRAAIFDTGIERTVPAIAATLEAVGLDLEAVDYIVPTHVHLDHAGGAGRLMQVCPNARLVIHPRGAPHMIDPARLIAGAEAVYGVEGLRASVGEIVPVAVERVDEAADGYRFSLAGRELTVVDTPGHARHHFCVWDERSRGFFTGDTFGIAYPEMRCDGHPFVFPPTTPVQFDPAAWHESLDRLMAWNPERMYLTHFGMLENPAAHVAGLHRSIDDLAGLARRYAPDGKALEAAVLGYLLARADEAGCHLDPDHSREVLALDIDLICQGLLVWMQRQS